MTVGQEEGEVMHFYEDHQNHPCQQQTLTSDRQQQIEEDLALTTRKEFTHMNILTPLNASRNHY